MSVIRRRVFTVSIIGALVVTIWLVNAKFFSKIQKHRNETASQISSHAVESLTTPDSEFVPVKRDPFNVVIDTTPPEPVMPEFSLHGVLISDQGALALMQLPDGNVYVLKQGEQYLGVTIRRITPKDVTCEFRGRQEIFPVTQ